MSDTYNVNAYQPIGTISGTNLILVYDPVTNQRRKMTYAELTGAQQLALATAWVDNEDGTGDVTLTFTLNGDVPSTPISGIFFVATEAVGIAAVALGTGASAGTGQITPIASTSQYHFVTDVNGVLAMTLTSDADSYWLVFQQGDGTHLVSDELAITGP